MTDVLRISYLGQSGFFIETSDSKILIDPRDEKSGDLDGDLVYCTHKHSDHTDVECVIPLKGRPLNGYG